MSSKKKMIKIQAAEIKFLLPVKKRKVTDSIRKEEVRKELDIFSIEEKRKEYKIRWLGYLQKINSGRTVK
jgi:hypothetical protein